MLRIEEQVVAKLDVQRRADAARRRWFWASVLARLFMLWELFKLGFAPFALYMQLRSREIAAKPMSSVSSEWLNAGLIMFGSAAALVIGLLACRYCLAKSEDRVMGKAPR